MKIGRPVLAFLATGLLAAMAYGQEYPFSDDFSVPSQTNLKWAKWFLADDSISAVCSGVVYTITNHHKGTMPAVYCHGFSAKTSTFTASCVIARSSADIAAGILLCLPAYSNFSGYAVQLQGPLGGNNCINYVTISRYVSNSGSMVWQAEFHQRNLVNPSDTLKVSRQGGTLTVFCNGVYLGSYTDPSPLAAGDLGLLVPGNSSAAFDDVLFTDQFTQGSFPVSFKDNFNNGDIAKQWLLRSCSDFNEHDTVLDITSSGSVSTGVFSEVKMSIDTFYSMLVVSHRSGDSASYYGFYLRGPDTLSTFRAAMFGISGQRAGGAYLSSGGAVFFSPIIRGKAFVNSIPPYDTTFYQDTIVVKKASGSNFFIMNVNGHAFDTLTALEITFPIVGAGIFVGGGQNVFADYFAVGPDSSVTGVINLARNVRLVKGMKFAPLTSRYLFNPLGRVIGVRDASGRRYGSMLAPGFYITDQKQSGIIINKELR
jgi:hypothetical protein